MSQSRLLPSWPPLRTCCENGPWGLHEEPAAFDRIDGRCYWHGKVADGKCSARRHNPRMNTCGKYPWRDWLDGNEHIVNPAASFHAFSVAAARAAERRDMTVKVWEVDGAVHHRAIPRAARAA